MTNYVPFLHHAQLQGTDNTRSVPKYADSPLAIWFLNFCLRCGACFILAIIVCTSLDVSRWTLYLHVSGKYKILLMLHTSSIQIPLLVMNLQLVRRAACIWYMNMLDAWLEHCLSFRPVIAWVPGNRTAKWGSSLNGLQGHSIPSIRALGKNLYAIRWLTVTLRSGTIMEYRSAIIAQHLSAMPYQVEFRHSYVWDAFLYASNISFPADGYAKWGLSMHHAFASGIFWTNRVIGPLGSPTALRDLNNFITRFYRSGPLGESGTDG